MRRTERIASIRRAGSAEALRKKYMQNFPKKGTIMPGMSENPMDQLPGWLTHTLDALGVASTAAMAKIAHRYAQQSKRHAELSQIKSQVKDHEARLSDLENLVDRNHSATLREIRRAEASLMHALSGRGNPIE